VVGTLKLARPDSPPAAAEVSPVTAAFMKNARHAHAIAYRILGRPADVDDLLQDLYIIAARDLKDLSNDFAVRRWFTVATVRLARRVARQQRIRAFFALDDPEVPEVVAPGATPEQRAEVTRLFSVLEQLPLDQRIAWTLRRLEGLQLDEVALACKCSLATAKRHIAHADDIIQEVWK
jgi:RNA polymerase sigma-70 factor (ECF subfamily)